MSRFPVITVARRFLGGAPGTRRGRARLIGAVLGVAVSMIPLVVVQQVADGMISGIVDRFIETGTYHIRGSARLPVTPEEADTLMARVRTIPGVQSATLERQGFGLVYSDTGRSGVTLRAVPQQFWDDDPALQRLLAVEAGTFDLQSDDAIILGVEIAGRLGVSPGDEIRVLTVRPLGDGRMLPRVSRFTVTGVVSTGYRDLDRLWSFIPLERGRRVIPEESAQEIAGIKVTDPYSLPNPLVRRGAAGLFSRREVRGMEQTLQAVRATLGVGWFAQDWYHAEQGRYISFLTSRNLLAFVMALIIAVAAINISSALVLLVVEKGDEIAVLRALGVSRGQIALIFVLCGAGVGVVGALVGAVTGVMLAVNVNTILGALERVMNILAGRPVELLSADFYLEEIPVVLSSGPLFAAVFLAMLLAVAAALVPARRAAKIPPDQVLRRH